MKTIIFIVALFSLIISCDRKDQAGATGSGAGIHEEPRNNNLQNAGTDDMNITTPIDERVEEEQDVEN